MKKLMMKIARSPLGGALAHIALTRFSRLLPIQVAARDRWALMIRHPLPMKEGHRLIVPTIRAKTIDDLLSHENAWRDVARFIRTHADPGKCDLICNVGNRQEVGQVHIHALPRTEGEIPFFLPEEGRAWRIEDGARCLIPIDRLEDEVLLRAALEEGRRVHPDGLSLIWKHRNPPGETRSPETPA